MSSNGSSAASASRSLITTLQIAVRPFVLEHLAQQVERLAADLVGLDVVGLLHELRVLAGRLARAVVNCSISIERTVLSGTFSRSSSVITTYWSGAYS